MDRTDRIMDKIMTFLLIASTVVFLLNMTVCIKDAHADDLSEKIARLDVELAQKLQREPIEIELRGNISSNDSGIVINNYYSTIIKQTIIRQIIQVITNNQYVTNVTNNYITNVTNTYINNITNNYNIYIGHHKKEKKEHKIKTDDKVHIKIVGDMAEKPKHEYRKEPKERKCK